MKRRVFLLVLLFLPSFFAAGADDVDFQDWDMDTLFDEPVDEQGEDAAGEGRPPVQVRQEGFSLTASYYFNGGIAPGWTQAPWHWGSSETEYSHLLGLGMFSGIGLDFQISNVLRVTNTFGFFYPGFFLYVRNFFFDYTIKNTVFIRAGKYEPAWGISPNFQFTNLLSRVPDNSSGGDAVIVKADIPIGVGGLQVLALNRRGFIKSGRVTPGLREIGYGAKYNLAFPWADIDMGAFFLADMPLRGFISVKKTVKNTEIYAEGMSSVQHPLGDRYDAWGNLKFSANMGFVQDFFVNKLTVNGELFYNGEKATGWFSPETNLQDAEISPFIGGLNTALNLRFRPGWWKKFRFGLQFLYAFDENTAQLVPGLTFDPLPHMVVSFAVPMALGSANGTYYTHNADKNNRPFSIVLLISISGSRRFGFYD
ncbi:hypothetical protein FACS1894163_06900 [Spirochaetia bacterium]|nr:hypothetical protein FACS1894163_06900 [Spirochaetia bacterium]